MAKGLELFKDRVRAKTGAVFKCHGSESVKSGFDMTDRDKLLEEMAVASCRTSRLRVCYAN